jgi:hypothetical protein
MVKVRRCAEFRADFPDDHIWNEDEPDDVVQTGGKAVAEALADILRSFGCTIEELEDNPGHCWDCCFTYEGLVLWFHVVGSERCIFVLDEPLRAQRGYDRHLEVLLKLNEHMRRDGRFHDLRWYEDGRGSREPFDVPVAGDVPPMKRKRVQDRPHLGEIKRGRFLGRLLASLTARRPTD